MKNIILSTIIFLNFFYIYPIKSNSGIDSMIQQQNWIINDALNKSSKKMVNPLKKKITDLQKKLKSAQYEYADEMRRYKGYEKRIQVLLTEKIPYFHEFKRLNGDKKYYDLTPEECIADCNRQIEEFKKEKETIYNKLPALHHVIQILKHQLADLTAQAEFSEYSDTLEDTQLNDYAYLTQQKITVNPKDFIPSALQIATLEALKESVSDSSLHSQAAQTAAELIKNYCEIPSDEYIPSALLENNIKKILNTKETIPSDTFQNTTEQMAAQLLNMPDDTALKYLDTSGKISAVFNSAKEIANLTETIESAQKLNKSAGEDMAMAYLSAKIAAKIADVAGGMYGAAGTYLEIGAKALETGANITAKATLGKNREVPAAKINFGPNKAIQKYSTESESGGRVLNITAGNKTSSIEIHSWKQIYVNTSEAWVPMDADQNSLPYVFVVKSRPFCLGLFGTYDMEVYDADTNQVDNTGIVTLKDRGAYKN